jgi:hypothetical protein
MLVWINRDRTFAQLSKRSYSASGRELWMANFITFYVRYKTLHFQGSVSFKMTFISPVSPAARNLLAKITYVCQHVSLFSLFILCLLWLLMCGNSVGDQTFVSQQCCALDSDIARKKCNFFLVNFWWSRAILCLFTWWAQRPMANYSQHEYKTTAIRQTQGQQQQRQQQKQENWISEGYLHLNAIF